MKRNKWEISFKRADENIMRQEYTVHIRLFDTD